MDRKNLAISPVFDITDTRIAFCYSGKIVGFLLFLLLCSFTTIAAAAGNIEIIGSWVSGTSHSEETGTDRALVFTAHVETNNSNTDLGSVTYGGQSMTKVVDGIYTSGLSAYTAAFILDEAGINAASGNSFVVTWNTAPSGTPEFTSVFLQNVNQSSLTGATGVGGSSTTTAQTPALSTSNGDMAIVAGTNGNTGTYSTINGFTEAIEVAPSSADGIAGYLSSTGGNVTPGVSHTSVNRQSVIGFVVNADTAPVPPGQASNPGPADSETNVSVNTDLSWTAGAGATSHDVYFGTSDPPASQGNQDGATFDPGTMNTATTYYWRIDEINAYGTTTGTVWSFTTMDIYDVTDYGATGNGSTLDTDAINAAITAADANGGGVVYFPPGTFKSGSIIMKNNITLDIDANAIIMATDTNDYSLVDDNPWDMYQDWGHSHWKSSLIWGVGVENVAITGSGLINGQAMTAGDPADYYGDRAISFKLCTGILIKDITIYMGGHFGIITMGCNDVTIENVLIDTNRDGINIDCCNDVNIVDCIVNSPKDDAICMKSSYGLGYKRPTENVNISRCTVMGHGVGYLLPQFPEGDEGWNAGRIKFGTESNGGFKNITITDCNFEYCYGFMLATVDGGDMENIYISNIKMTELFTPPIFIRLGNRARGPGPPPPGIIRNLNMTDITAQTDCWGLSCIVSGIPGYRIEDVNFTDIDINYPGGGTEEHSNIVLPENETGYPDVFMFGQITPCYGFYSRHVNGIEFHNVKLTTVNSDERPEKVFIDVDNIVIDNFTSKVASPPDGAMVFQGVPITLSASVTGGIPPYTYQWHSDIDGYIGNGEELVTSQLSVNRSENSLLPHEIKLTVIDSNSDVDVSFSDLTVKFRSDFTSDGYVEFEDMNVMVNDWLVKNYIVEGTYDDGYYEIPHVFTAPIIDGILDAGEWNGALVVDLADPMPRGWSIGSDDISTTWYYMWDADFLYLGARVYDAEHEFTASWPGPYHTQDVLQLSFNPNNDPNHTYQHGVGVAAIYDVVAQSSDGGPDVYRHGLPFDKNGLTVDGTVHTDGYTVETSLPWSELMVGEDTSYIPDVNDVHGFGLTIMSYGSGLTRITDFGDGEDKLSQPAYWNTMTLVQELNNCRGGYYDHDLVEDCTINLKDFAVFANKWLAETN